MSKLLKVFDELTHDDEGGRKRKKRKRV